MGVVSRVMLLSAARGVVAACIAFCALLPVMVVVGVMIRVVAVASGTGERFECVATRYCHCAGSACIAPTNTGSDATATATTM